MLSLDRPDVKQKVQINVQIYYDELRKNGTQREIKDNLQNSRFRRKITKLRNYRL